jgi:hypothetical protein
MAKKIFLLAMVSAALHWGAAWAEGVRFEASVPNESITLDQTVELTISLERDGSQAFEAYRAPSAPDFEVLHSGTSEQMQWQTINGRQSVRVIEQHVYVLRPRKKGAFTIGPAAIRIAGQEVHTRSITIHVAPIPKNAISLNPPPQAQSLLPAPDALRADDEVFVDATTDKAKVYVGQQVTATWRLYTMSELLKYRSLADPKHEDFWGENLIAQGAHVAWDRQLVRGREYSVATLIKKALFPLKAGSLTITPLEVEATTLQSAFFAGASASKKSRALTVEVLPLPAAGRPADFSPSNVGTYTVKSEVDRKTVKAGEAVSWKITLSGTGNLHNAKVPRPEGLDGFKVYEPTLKEDLARDDTIRGEKSYTYLLMPQKGGKLILPAVQFAYFDPQAAKYDVAKAPPIELTIEGDPAAMQNAQNTPSQDNVLDRQVRPIRNRASVHSRIGERLWRGPKLAAVLLATPPVLWVIVLAGDALRRRLSRDTPGARRRRARKGARKRLRKAEYHIKAQRPPAFFGECARVLYEHLEYRLGVKVEALTLSELRAHLESRGFSKETSEGVVKELENCDFARFAPSASGPGEMRAALRRVRTLLGWIEQVKPQSEVTQEAA